MKLGIMQPYFFPYIGYWQLINAVDRYVIYDDVNFIKGGWINRNQILLNGGAKMINLKMSGSSPNKLINEVQVSQDALYTQKTLRCIESCYKKAPYFYEAFAVIEDILTWQEEKSIAKHLEYSIRKICAYLSIHTELVVSSTINKDNSLKGQDKVISICKILGADQYYNAIGGQKLYCYQDFAQQGIKLRFLKSLEVTYPQFGGEFVPNLSIIDVMMFCSIEKIRSLLMQYELI